MIKRFLLVMAFIALSLVWMAVAVFITLPEFVITGKSRAVDWITEKWISPLVDKIEEAGQ